MHIMNSNSDQTKEENLDKENIDVEQTDNKRIEIEDKYNFGWSIYSEITNGRFAMLGFLAIILIELLSQKPFLTWAGIF